MKDIEIDEMRKAMGTLPDRTEEKTYDYVNALEVSHVELRDWPKNVMKNIVNAALSTWGSGKLGSDSGSCKKWEKLSPVNRFRVVLAALTNQTLPLALENVKFQFEFNGIPRHTFDQWARARLAAHQSIGCRDNSKLDAPFVLYPQLYKMIKKDDKMRIIFERWVKETKDLYELILNKGRGSYQIARAVLPMSYNHSWTSSIDLNSLKRQLGRRLMACEEAPHVLMAWKIREEIDKKVSPLIANYLRPACDCAKKCLYAGGSEGLVKYFSLLFKPCGRWPVDFKYAEFNMSCSNYEELSKYVKIVNPDEWIDYTADDYEKLDKKDKILFEED